jgi:hypothetical protein
MSLARSRVAPLEPPAGRAHLRRGPPLCLLGVRPRAGRAVGVLHHSDTRSGAASDDGNAAIVPAAHGLNPVVGGTG